MQGQKFISRMNFEANKHHRQILREQIKPELIQKLEVNDNPSANYMKAYRNIYKDELEKTMEEHQQKKYEQEHHNLEDKLTYSLQQPRDKIASTQNQAYQQYSPQQSYSQQYSPHQSYSQAPSPQQTYSPKDQNGHTFRDYFQERGNRFEDHIKRNFDGGNDFFKVQDAYRQKKMKETVDYASVLRKQLEEKNYHKYTEKEKENMEQAAIREMQAYQQQLDHQKYMSEVSKRSCEKAEKIHEVEEERNRRQRRSKQFQYNNYALHNPITNPIEYHIDNPYILKKIQDKNSL